MWRRKCLNLLSFSKKHRLDFVTILNNSNDKEMAKEAKKGLQRSKVRCLRIHLTLYTLVSIFIFSWLLSFHFIWHWQGEFYWQSGASQIGDHFLYSHDLNVWFKGEIVKRNQKPVTLRGKGLVLVWEGLRVSPNLKERMNKLNRG